MADFINYSNSKIMMIIAMSSFGLLGTMSRFVNLPSSIIVLGRGVIGSIFILAVIYIGKSRLDMEAIGANRFILILSGIFLGLNWLFLFEAYKTIEISVATVCNYLTPAFVILVAPIFLKERLTIVKLASALVALLGLVLISGILEGGTEFNLWGITLGVSAAVFYTAMIIANKKLRSIGSFDKTFAQLAVATVVVLIYCIFDVDFTSLTFDTTSIVLLVIMAVLCTGVTFTLYFGSLAYMEAQSAVIYGYLEPIIGLMLSVVILGEDLGPIGWFGAFLVLGSTLAPELLELYRIRKYSPTIKAEK